MDIINSLFQNKLDHYLSIQHGINPSGSPDHLIKLLLKSKSDYKYLKKKLSSKTKNIFKVFKRLSICSLLLFVSQIPLIKTQNEWIDKQFIEPYYLFLKKIVYSNQMYQNTKKLCPMPVGKNLQMLFYNISLLKMLFKIVNKMALLGRYYKSKNQEIVTTFITTIALQAQKIYVSFRQILGHMIQNPKIHIPSKNEEIMMKGVLRDQLSYINQQMKKLFLDKYFYPLGKGIGIKLFKPQEQPRESEKIIKGIINDHQDTMREQRKNQLQNTLFPEPGKINMKFYQQTLMSHMLIHVQDKDNFDQQVLQVDIQYQGSDNQNQQYVDSQTIKNNKNKTYIKNETGKINQNDIQTGIQRYEQNITYI